MRPTGMSRRALVILSALPVLLAGCGDVPVTRDAATGRSGSPTLVCDGHASPARTSLDLDGDGAADEVAVNGAAVQGRCRDAVAAQVAGRELTAPLRDASAVRSADLAGVRVPGRSGELLLVTARHPRGGFQAHLFAYADGRFAELEVDGRPVLGFVATDTTSTPTAVRCEPGGFTVLEARTHQPIGVRAAWDVVGTAYSLDGTTLTRGATTAIADDVTDRDLHRHYADLVRHDPFRGCRADR
jgi:hypothetical protein